MPSSQTESTTTVRPPGATSPVVRGGSRVEISIKPDFARSRRWDLAMNRSIHVLKVVLSVAAWPFAALLMFAVAEIALFEFLIGPCLVTYYWSLGILTIAREVVNDLGHGRYGAAILDVLLLVYLTIFTAICASIPVAICWGIGNSVKESIEGTVSKWNKARLRRQKDRNPYLRSLPPL